MLEVPLHHQFGLLGCLRIVRDAIIERDETKVRRESVDLLTPCTSASVPAIDWRRVRLARVAHSRIACRRPHVARVGPPACVHRVDAAEVLVACRSGRCCLHVLLRRRAIPSARRTRGRVREIALRRVERVRG